MASRVIYRFQQGARGWTEVFYSSSDPATAVGVAESQPWINARLNIMANTSKLISVTAVLIGGNRQSAVRTVNQVGGRVTPDDNEPEYTETCAFYRFTSDRHTRGYWARALNEFDTLLDPLTGDWAVFPGIRPLYDVLVTVTKGRYSTYGYDSLTNAPWKPMVLAENNGVGFARFTLSAGGVVPPVGQNVYFKGLGPFLSGFLRGPAKVIASGTPALTFDVQLAWPSGLASQPLIAPASVRSAEKVLSGITSGSLLRISDHDTGRPTNLPRGRARGRRLRRSIPVGA